MTQNSDAPHLTRKDSLIKQPLRRGGEGNVLKGLNYSKPGYYSKPHKHKQCIQMKQNASKCILIKEHNDQGGMAGVLGDDALAPIKFTFLYLNQQMAQGRPPVPPPPVYAFN